MKIKTISNLFLLMIACGCHSTKDQVDIVTGAKAFKSFERSDCYRLGMKCNIDKLAATHSESFRWGGGNVFGTNMYWVIKCENSIETKKLFEETLSSVSDIKEYYSKPVIYTANLHGPKSYGDDRWDKLWLVDNITNGYVIEFPEEDRKLTFVAIDIDLCVIYGHYETGGIGPNEVDRFTNTH